MTHITTSTTNMITIIIIIIVMMMIIIIIITTSINITVINSPATKDVPDITINQNSNITNNTTTNTTDNIHTTTTTTNNNIDNNNNDIMFAVVIIIMIIISDQGCPRHRAPLRPPVVGSGEGDEPSGDVYSELQTHSSFLLFLLGGVKLAGIKMPKHPYGESNESAPAGDQRVGRERPGRSRHV